MKGATNPSPIPKSTQPPCSAWAPAANDGTAHSIARAWRSSPMESRATTSSIWPSAASASFSATANSTMPAKISSKPITPCTPGAALIPPLGFSMSTIRATIATAARCSFRRCAYIWSSNRMNKAIVALLLSLLAFGAAVQSQTQNPPPKSVAERLGYPANSRVLVIHADDFGMSHSVNRAIMEALENHWVTSASILVPCPWFPEVAQWAKAHPDSDLGIHLALNSEWTTLRWGPVSPQPKNSSLLDPDGYLPLTTEYVASHTKISYVETETHAQVDKAKAAGINLTHLDTHMGAIVTTPDLFNAYLALGRAYKLPLLLDNRAEAAAPGSVLLSQLLQMNRGTPKSQWLDAYKKMLAPLPPGSYQLIVHLAYNDDEMQGATYDHPDWGAEWRQSDLDLVRSAEFQKFLKDQGFILLAWKDLAKALPK